ncbi:MAG TPA: hypothetical protein VN776_01995 [Terracidiphilus sp.]|nr:hypothetical protein [Terracidiphilus sp.]
MSERAEKDKAKFDWVAERTACSLPRVFKTLKLEVEEDVRVRNAARPEAAKYEFSLVEKENAFSVVLDAESFHRSVTFALEDHAILALDSSGNQMFEVTLNFTDDGKCKMNAKQQNRESWQVRRMALEDLLFRIV